MKIFEIKTIVFEGKDESIWLGKLNVVVKITIFLFGRKIFMREHSQSVISKIPDAPRCRCFVEPVISDSLIFHSND